MIDIGKILKRAWSILWNYRVLWIFAILVVLFGGSASGRVSSSGNSGSSYQFNQPSRPDYQPGPALRELTDWFTQNINPLFDHPDQHVTAFIWIGVAVVLFILVMSAITALVRYPAETAIFRMVDEHEQNGTTLSFKQGWNLGWSRRAFRIWVIDLVVVALPGFLLVLVMLGIGLGVYSSVTSGSFPAGVAGMVTAAAFTFLFLIVFTLGMVFLGLLRQFFARMIALEDAGIGESLRGGWAMLKANWKSTGLMWLVMLGVGIGVGIGMFILTILLIPVYILLVLPAALVAVVPGLIAFGISSLFASGTVAVIIGILVAFPFFILVVFAPLTLISAWYVLYESNVWTLTYREMKALGHLQPVEARPPLAS